MPRRVHRSRRARQAGSAGRREVRLARGRERYGRWERDMEAAGLDPEEHRGEWHHVCPEDIPSLREVGAFVALRERLHELEK